MKLFGKLFKMSVCVAIGASATYAGADDGSNLWLKPLPSVVKTAEQTSTAAKTAEIIQAELKNFTKVRQVQIVLDTAEAKAHENDSFTISGNSQKITITAKNEIGALYGVYHLLRLQDTGFSFADTFTIKETPACKYRMLNHWDNMNGTIERGYAGNSIWKWNELPGTISPRYEQYARANASIGINSVVLNNVNADRRMLATDTLNKVKVIAGVLRPYGIRVFLSVNFSSPRTVGGLRTADPLDPQVIAWWKSKVDEIYKLIPDFGGFLVKANSEGQSGPCDYGRTHADGANVMADALKPHGGVVIWRAFVYARKEVERIQQALLEFKALEGKFHDNVVVQAKNGPLDFQPCEPFHPLFGKIDNIPLGMEFQITQEYLGQSNHMAYLAPLWKEVLDSDTYQYGPGSTVAKRIKQASMIAGVANIGDDVNWCRHPFAQANWYAFGRLAWNPDLKSEDIAKEWLKQTFSSDPKFVDPVADMMMSSVPAIRNYMMPLGLQHIFASTLGNHYGPGPWLYQSVYNADKNGVGPDRTTSGTGAVKQYNAPLDEQFNKLDTCPERYWLWFHRIAWTEKVHGVTFWEYLCSRFEEGARTAATYPEIWKKMQKYVDKERYELVLGRLQLQAREAVWWKDACILFYQSCNGLPIPNGITKPIYDLNKLKRVSFPNNVHFCPSPDSVNRALDNALIK